MSNKRVEGGGGGEGLSELKGHVNFFSNLTFPILKYFQVKKELEVGTGDFMKKVPWLPVCPRDR